eukprot:13180003-Ditylum_brightwellii.AAC.1
MRPTIVAVIKAAPLDALCKKPKLVMPRRWVSMGRTEGLTIVPERRERKRIAQRRYITFVFLIGVGGVVGVE